MIIVAATHRVSLHLLCEDKGQFGPHLRSQQILTADEMRPYSLGFTDGADVVVVRKRAISIMVRAGGLEPPWAYARRILSPLRLPVPPCPHYASQ